MGKLAKTFFVLSIIVSIGCATVMIVAKATEAKLVWDADGDEFSGNNTVNLVSSTYILEASYYFQYYEETTMSITVYFENTETSEVETVSLSISPQSDYVERLSDYETFVISVQGSYEITYSCSHPYFMASSSSFTLVKASTIGDLSNLEEVVTNAELDIPNPAFRFSMLVLIFSILALLISGISVLPEFAEKRRLKANAQVTGNISTEKMSMNQQQTYSYHQHSWQPSDSNQATYQDTQAQQDVQHQQNTWICYYCNAKNDNTGSFCASCGNKRDA